MAEVTVKKLAEDVGTPVDRLLKQMQESGLPHKSESDNVSEEQKKVLLSFLKKSHGREEGTVKKVTLKRKVTTKLKSTGNTGGKAKTVSIEVRKKRTYVKPDNDDAQQQKELARKKAADETRRQEEDEKLAKAQKEAAKQKAATIEIERKRVESIKRKQQQEIARIIEKEKVLTNMQEHLAHIQELEAERAAKHQEKRDKAKQKVRSPRFEALRGLHFVAGTRVHRTMAWVVYFSSLS